MVDGRDASLCGSSALAHRLEAELQRGLRRLAVGRADEDDGAGLAVGLPEGTMGNSEVGHITIGAGAVDYQDLVKINLAVEDGSMATRPALVDAFAKAKAGSGKLHFSAGSALKDAGGPQESLRRKARPKASAEAAAGAMGGESRGAVGERANKDWAAASAERARPSN